MKQKQNMKLVIGIVLMFLIIIATQLFSFEPKTYSVTLLTMFDKEKTIMARELENFADEVRSITKGRIDISIEYIDDRKENKTVFAALEDVSDDSNTIHMLHGASYYWKEEIPEAAFFSSRPFGMYHDTYVKWLEEEGMHLWEKMYEEHGLNVVPFSMGHTGPQWGGVSNVSIERIEDFDSLHVRMPGLGGELLKKFGAIIHQVEPQEIPRFTVGSTKKLIEWVGPFEDKNVVLENWRPKNDTVYYYENCWHEPNTMLELLVNKRFFNSLDEDLQIRLKKVIEKYDLIIFSKFLELNDLTGEHLRSGTIRINDLVIIIQKYPKEIIAEFKEEFAKMMTNYEESHQNCQLCKQIISSYNHFLNSSANEWEETSY